MKRFIIFVSVLLGVAMAAGLVSCDRIDYPDRYRATDGIPAIYGVRYVESGITTDQAYMEETICILGENLRSIHRILFNDQEAILNTSFITDNTLLVTVPKTMASVETNKIYFITASGNIVTYDFNVLPPAPRVTDMSFEYAEPGSTVSIYGSYFYEKEGKEMSVEFSGAEVPHSDITIVSMDEIKVKVPEGAQPGRVKVTTPSGLAQSTFMYNDNRGLLFDFDGTNSLYTVNFGWHPCSLADDGVSGKCLLASDGSQEFAADGTDWQDGKCHFEYWAGNWQDPETYGNGDGRRLNDIIDFTDYANMALKFEVKIDPSAPWTGCPMQIIFSSVTMVSNGNAGVTDIYGNTLAGCNNTYVNDATLSLPRYLWRPWADTGSYDTGGEWRTVTIPISSFTMFWDGSNATGSLTKETFANLEFFFAAGPAAGTACKPIIKIDNIRAVPAK